MSPPSLNRRCVLARRPKGEIEDADFVIEDAPLESLEPGEFLVQVSLLALDPAMRGWMNDIRSYIPPVAIGEVMRAFGVGTVVSSREPRVVEGSVVSGSFGVQRYATASIKGVSVISPLRAPREKYLSVLGLTGLSAYFGLLDVGRPQPGETVVVSAAAGGVGSVVGQIARLQGCRVVGIAGGEQKCRYLKERLRFDDVVDYRAEKVRSGLRRACPEGVDVFFDNVGGDTLDAALASLTRGARVVICGAVSQYNAVGPPQGPANYLSLLVNRASMAGFIVFDYEDRFEEALAHLSSWMIAGDVVSDEEVMRGIGSFPDALRRLFNGDKTGKLLLDVTA